MQFTFKDFYDKLEKNERFTINNGEAVYTFAKPITNYLYKKYKDVEVKYYENTLPTLKNANSRHYIEFGRVVD